MRNKDYRMMITRWTPSWHIGLSIGPTHIYKQTLYIDKVPLLVVRPVRFIDSGTHMTMT